MDSFREHNRNCSRNFFGKCANLIAYFDRIGIINVYAQSAPCVGAQGQPRLLEGNYGTDSYD